MGGFNEMPLLEKIGFGIGGVAVAIFILWLLGTWCASCLDFTGHKYVAARPHRRRDDHDKASTDPDGDTATDSSYDDYASRDSDDSDDDSASCIRRSRRAYRDDANGRSGGASLASATSTDEESPTV